MKARIQEKYRDYLWRLAIETELQKEQFSDEPFPGKQYNKDLKTSPKRALVQNESQAASTSPEHAADTSAHDSDSERPGVSASTSPEHAAETSAHDSDRERPDVSVNISPSPDTKHKHVTFCIEIDSTEARAAQPTPTISSLTLASSRYARTRIEEYYAKLYTNLHPSHNEENDEAFVAEHYTQTQSAKRLLDSEKRLQRKKLLEEHNATDITDTQEDDLDSSIIIHDEEADIQIQDSEKYEDEVVTDQKPVSQEWYYDDRQSINGGAIDLRIFQGNTTKELDITLPKDHIKNLQDNNNKEHKTYHQYFEEITKEIEERSTVKPCSYLDEEENDDQEEKGIMQKMFDEVMGHRSILPKKYDIPDDVNFVPPHTITLSSFLPNMPVMPTYQDISSYFNQMVQDIVNGGKDKAKEMLKTETSCATIFLGAGVISSSLLGQSSLGAGVANFGHVFEHALSV